MDNSTPPQPALPVAPTTTPAVSTSSTTTPDATLSSTTVESGLSTTEFYFTFAITAVGLLIGSGLLTTNTAVQIAGLAAAVLKAGFYLWSRTKIKTSGSSSLPLVLIFIVVMPLAHAQLGCGSSLSGGGVKSDALNCAGPSAAKAIKDYGGAMDTAVASQLQDDGHLIKPTLESMLVGLVTDEAKCVGLNSLAKLLTPAAPVAGAAKSEPRAIDKDDVQAELAKMKTSLAPGREVVLPGQTQ
jgi:hypothetical protein